jgi:hypothetical protein
MEETPNSTEQVREVQTQKGILREGYLPDGSYLKVEHILNEEEL